jgi:hypothetical protein
MAFLRTNWAIITAAAAAIYFYAGVVSDVNALKVDIKDIQQMSTDIAVIKSRVEWLVQQRLEDERSQSRRGGK